MRRVLLRMLFAVVSSRKEIMWYLALLTLIFFAIPALDQTRTGSIFLTFIANQLGGALLFFPIVWLVMCKKDGQKLSVGNLWLIAGFFATDIGAAVVRFMALFVIGDEALHPNGGFSVFFTLALPILVAICVCAFLRTKAIPAAKAESA